MKKSPERVIIDLDTIMAPLNDNEEIIEALSENHSIQSEVSNEEQGQVQDQEEEKMDNKNENPSKQKEFKVNHSIKKKENENILDTINENNFFTEESSTQKKSIESSESKPKPEPIENEDEGDIVEVYKVVPQSQEQYNVFVEETIEQLNELVCLSK